MKVKDIFQSGLLTVGLLLNQQAPAAPTHSTSPKFPALRFDFASKNNSTNSETGVLSEQDLIKHKFAKVDISKLSPEFLTLYNNLLEAQIAEIQKIQSALPPSTKKSEYLPAAQYPKDIYVATSENGAPAASFRSTPEGAPFLLINPGYMEADSAYVKKYFYSNAEEWINNNVHNGMLVNIRNKTNNTVAKKIFADYKNLARKLGVDAELYFNVLDLSEAPAFFALDTGESKKSILINGAMLKELNEEQIMGLLATSLATKNTPEAIADQHNRSVLLNANMEVPARLNNDKMREAIFAGDQYAANVLGSSGKIIEGLQKLITLEAAQNGGKTNMNAFVDSRKPRALPTALERIEALKEIKLPFQTPSVHAR